MIYINIILTVLVVAVSVIAFFMLAIWRAILGKTSIDGRLATTVTIFNKKLDNMDSNFNKYSDSQNKLSTELKDIKNLLRGLKSMRNENTDVRGDIK